MRARAIALQSPGNQRQITCRIRRRARWRGSTSTALVFPSLFNRWPLLAPQSLAFAGAGHAGA